MQIKERAEVGISTKHKDRGYGLSYKWGYEAGVAGKPMPRAEIFGSVEQYQAWRDGHAAGVASCKGEALISDPLLEADAAISNASVEEET